MINCAEVKYCKFVIWVINATGWYVYIWIFVMEPSVNSDVHLICQLPSALQRNFQVTAWCISTDRAKTSGTPDVVSGSFMTVDPLDLIIFLVPSRVHITPMKFMDVKSVPKMMGRCICLQTMKDWVNGWSLIVKVQVT